MRKLNYKLLGIAALAVAFTACEEGDLTANGEVEAAMGELYVNAEGTASQLFKNVDEAMRKLSAGDALPYTIDGAEFDEDPGTAGRYTFDYTGVNGAGVSTRGKMINGEVIVVLTGTDYLTPTSSVNVTYDNYSEDSKPVLGNIVVTNTGDGTSQSFDMDINGLTIEDDTPTDDGGPKAMVLNSQKALTWTDGDATLNDASDDKYEIADRVGGTATSASYDAGIYGFNITLTSPLKIDNTCQYRLTEGIIDLDISTTNDPSDLTFTGATIDFLSADGCDKFFSIDLENDNTGASITDLTRQFNGF